MRRRILIALALLVALIGFTAVRGNRRTPGAAAATGPEEQLDGGIRRIDLRFPCGASMCAGWLYLPARDAPVPVVVMGHGFAGTRDVGLAVPAERFAREGIAAFVFDYRSFGASGGLPRQIVDPWQQLDDWRAAVAFMRARAGVDGSRLALWGASLGAGHALLIAAEDRQVRAVVAQAPLIDTSVEGEATFYGVAWAARLVLTGWADLVCSAFGCDPVTLPAIARSGDFGMIIDDAAYAAFEKLVAPASTYRNAVAARSIFTFDDYNPATRTAAITAPVLLIASRTDRFAPFAAVQAYAERAAKVRVETYEGDHFDVYSPPAVTHAADVAARFLAAHLGRAQRELAQFMGSD
jgi:pimeloyl-ACP methyl ester carboxylesterase